MMEQRFFRFTWTLAIFTLIAWLLYCRHLDQEFKENVRAAAAWDSKAQLIHRACSVPSNKSAMDCMINADEKRRALAAETNIEELGATMHWAGVWTVAMPVGIIFLFYLVRWLITGRLRAK